MVQEQPYKIINENVKTFLKKFKIQNIKKMLVEKKFLPKKSNINKLITSNLMKLLYQ
jgi:hypothetical protein